MGYKLSEKERKAILEMNLRGLDINKELNNIKEYIELLEDDKQWYIDKVRELRDEYDKDKEVKELKEKIELLESSSLYTLSDNQKK